jgi:hypothetical protein
MAFITKETTKLIRNALKAEFPEIKFSITMRDHAKIFVKIMKSPYFAEGESNSSGFYHLRNHASKDVIAKIEDIVRITGNYYDDSDAMTDYFDTAFYYDIEVGSWDKPHVKTS